MEIWSAYMRAVAGTPPQKEIAERAGVSQGTVSRWTNGVIAPDAAAAVAAFCRAYGRNPIEGFVAAGMITEDEAGRSLKKSERDFLAQVRRDVAVYAAGRREAQDPEQADESERSSREA